MKTLRFGIIGLGNIGRQHVANLAANLVGRGVLAAVATSSLDKAKEACPESTLVFPNPETLLRSGEIDAVLIATPHYSHLPLGIAALESGLHVMVEKPIAAHKADAEQLVAAAARHPLRLFSAMFQKRAEPGFQKIRSLIHEGKLGRLVRVNWLNTDWFRSHAYYASGGWRATWRGEGGGVLLNQALHHLDMLAWLVGQPARVRAFCGFGKHHPIEVEDDVTAYLEWADGMTGTFIATTGEAPGTNRLEIAGTRGKLVLENGQLTVTLNTVDAVEFSMTTKEGFAKPAVTVETLPFPEPPNPHALLLQNFVDAALDGAPLLAPGAEGLNSLELANAMVLSALEDAIIDLPLDGALWAAKLEELSR